MKAPKDYVPYIYESEPTIRWPKGYIECWYYPILKSGNISKRYESYYRSFTPLKACACCGHLKTPRKIRTSYFPWYSEHSELTRKNKWWEWADYDKAYLCIGCWNKVNAIEKNYKKSKELEKLTKELKSINFKKRKEEKIK